MAFILIKSKKKKVIVFLITALQSCVFQKKKKKNLGQHSALFLTTTSTKDFSWSPDSAAAKIPIIVRGACNTGYFDGHNTQN